MSDKIIKILGYQEYESISTPVVSPSGKARMYFDTGSQTIKMSLSGSSYTDISSAASISLQNAYSGGNTITAADGSPITITGVGSAATSDTVNSFIISQTFSDGGVTSTTLVRSFYLSPTINYTATSRTGSYEALTVNVTESSVPTGPNYLMRLQIGGVDKLSLTNTGILTVSTVRAAAATTLNLGGGAVTSIQIDANRNVILNASGANVATNATNGFTYLPTVSGTPTGVPASLPTGAIPSLIDLTTNIMWLYNSGWTNLNATATGNAGGDLTGTYPNPTISQKGAANFQVLGWNVISNNTWQPESVILPTGTVAFGANQSMGSFKLTSLATPTVGTDAANKAYVDAQVSGGSVPGTNYMDYIPTAGQTMFTLPATPTNPQLVVFKLNAGHYTMPNQINVNGTSVVWTNDIRIETDDTVRIFY